MKVLLVLRMPNLSSYFESVIHELVKCHEVHLLFIERGNVSHIDSVVREVAKSKSKSRLSYNFDDSSNDIFWFASLYFRKLLNYASFKRRKEQSQHYVERYRRQLPVLIRWSSRLRNLLENRSVMGLLSSFEKKVPCSRSIIRRVKRISPDVILVSPHNKKPGKDLCYIKAAKKLSIPSSIITLSWDNLTSKGVINVEPNLLMVWNESQRNVAKDYHFLGESKIEVVGAPVFDKWFEYSKFGGCVPKRQEFLRKVGLHSDTKYVLYLGSAKNITGDESGIINQLIRGLQNPDIPHSKNLAVLVRPHPSNADYVDRVQMNNCVIYPRAGALPDTSKTKDEFYYSMLFAECVVGVNTSGILDAIINDIPVIAISDGRYRATQEETLHFRELLSFGCMETSSDIPSAVEVINKLAEGIDNRRCRRQKFVDTYIRPRGNERLVAKVVVSSLESLVRESHDVVLSR